MRGNTQTLREMIKWSDFVKHFRFAVYALLGIMIIIFIGVRTGVFNYVLGLSSDTAINLTIILAALNATLGLFSFLTLIVYTGFTGELVVADLKPKLYVVGEILDSGNGWNKSVMMDFLEEGHPKGPGFVYQSGNKKWDLEVHNNGDTPATNVEVTYIVTAYKHKIVFGIDKYDIKDYYPIECDTKKVTIKLDYIPPNTNQTFTVFFMDKFPKADLTIELLKCDDRTFINKPTRISIYYNQELNALEGSLHLRRMLGLDY